MPQLLDDDLSVPSQFVLNDKTCLVGFEISSDIELGFLQLSAAAEVSGTPTSPLFNPVLDAYTLTEIHVSNVRYCQPLLPEMGARAQSYAQFLAYRELAAKEAGKFKSYSEDPCFEMYSRYISEVEKAQGDLLPCSLREAAYYSFLIGKGKREEADAYIAEVTQARKDSVDKDSAKSCSQKVVAIDFKSRTIGKPEHLGSGGDS